MESKAGALFKASTEPDVCVGFVYEFSSGQGYWAVLKFFLQSSVYKAFLLYKSSISDNACTSLKAVLPSGSCERNYASKLLSFTQFRI